MSASALRVRRWVGRHWARLAIAAVLIGVVGGLALGLAAGTRRTDSAPTATPGTSAVTRTCSSPS